MDFKTIIKDDHIFHSFQNGDEKAFKLIYEALKYSIYTTTKKIVESPEDAEDVTVEAFALVWERRAAVKSMDHLKNLLHIIARNRSIDLLRNRANISRYSLDEILEELDTDNTIVYRNDQVFADLVGEIHKAMGCMPKLRKTVFQMRYLEERPADEVAASLNINVQAVYSHTKAALGQLRGMVSNNRANITELGIIALLLLHPALFGRFL
jgi:RNA polymerase sigma factor (sigma-70 family)